MLLNRARWLFLLAWGLTGLAAVAGSILGNFFGKRGLQTGAVIGGLTGVVLAVLIGVWLKWLTPSERLGATLGGWLGFAIAVPIAVFNLHTPVIPIASAALVGAGVLVGAARARA